MAKVNYCHPAYPYGYTQEDPEPALEMGVSEFHVEAFQCEYTTMTIWELLRRVFWR